MCDNSKHYFDMKIRHLSIGDWVLINGEPARVLRLTQVGHSIFKGLSGQMYRVIGGISPSPITPEILEKNGISKTYESDEYAVYKGEGFNVTEYYTELWELDISRNRLMIRNVHQLQHALRLLEVDKDIIL